MAFVHFKTCRISALASLSILLAPFSCRSQNVSATVRQISVGETLSLTFSGGQSSDFIWDLYGLDGQSQVELVKSEYFPKFAVGKISRGKYRFTLKGIRSGETKIEARLHRSWDDGEVLDAERVEIKVE